MTLCIALVDTSINSPPLPLCSLLVVMLWLPQRWFRVTTGVIPPMAGYPRVDSWLPQGCFHQASLVLQWSYWSHHWVHVIHLVPLRHGFVFFLPLHSSILKPDLNLALSQTQRMRNLQPSSAGEVAVKVELLLQFQSLVSGVGLPAALPLRSVLWSHPGVDRNITWPVARGGGSLVWVPLPGSGHIEPCVVIHLVPGFPAQVRALTIRTGTVGILFPWLTILLVVSCLSLCWQTSGDHVLSSCHNRQRSCSGNPRSW